MKQILYDTGWQTVARWPPKRRYKLEVVSYGEMTPRKIEKNKFNLKYIFRQTYFFQFLGG